MSPPLTPEVLQSETQSHTGSGGISAENVAHGFRPAFLDTETGIVHASRYADGRPAPFHSLDGLPCELVLARNPAGRVEQVRPSVVAGFVRAGCFYSREQAASHVCSGEAA